MHVGVNVTVLYKMFYGLFYPSTHSQMEYFNKRGLGVPIEQGRPRSSFIQNQWGWPPVSPPPEKKSTQWDSNEKSSIYGGDCVHHKAYLRFFLYIFFYDNG